MPKRILLIITGGIAAYKGLALIRLLKKEGHHVDVVLTEGALKFVTPLSVQALAGTEPHTALFSPTEESRIGHIALSRDADMIVVYPATANILAKMRHGFADDLASTILLATDKPIYVAPAMNHRMWNHPATQQNVEALAARGVHFIGPEEGDMACGEYGPGRAVEPENLVQIIRENEVDKVSDTAAGLRVLVTAGPTHEAIDPIRYIANRSSGKQGYAIAAAFAQCGAQVTLVSGPTSLPAPEDVARIQVTTAEEMLFACQQVGPVDIAVCVAAVADWRLETPSAHKLKKGGEERLQLSLVRNFDILAMISQPGPSRPPLVIGFAAETDDIQQNAAQKRTQKNCDWIIANGVDAQNAPFGQDDNTVTIIDDTSIETWPSLPKEEVAARLVQRAVKTVRSRSSHSR